jgi:hypothetical protein
MNVAFVPKSHVPIPIPEISSFSKLSSQAVQPVATGVGPIQNESSLHESSQS